MNDAMASVNPGQDAIGAIQETTAKPVSGVSKWRSAVRSEVRY